MTNYILKSMSKSSYKIVLNRQRIGSVIKRNEGWVGSIKDHRSNPCGSAQEAFTEIVKIANRIAICGENDIDAAYEVLREERRQLVKEVEEANKNCGFNAWHIFNRKITI